MSENLVEGATNAENPPKNLGLAFKTLGALGIVFGDIGTSPLYALRECFHGEHGISASADNVLGVLSLILWSLILIVSVKYLTFVLRADNKGEGGILALMSLCQTKKRGSPAVGMGWVGILGLFGATLLYGDGIITPAISVLSAVEGLNVATTAFQPYIIVITTAILVALFVVQSFGTARIGKAFGPILLLWFLALAVLGVKGIADDPQILWAINPLHAVSFFARNSWHGFLVLGSVVLVVTGGEALYADLGHFGRQPIRWGWFGVALPALVLQYLGQGAFLLQQPGAAENPFYLLAPKWALYPLVGLATIATIIASQAMITGAFSLSQQASRLGFLPRLKIKHTSAEAIGQIYVPIVNWALLAGTLALVFTFGSSSRLAAAYGIAVTGTMAITSLLFYRVVRRSWRWPRLYALPLVALFLSIDLAFLAANSLKFFDGGWVPLALAALMFILMSTWKDGRNILAERLVARSLPLEQFMGDWLPSVRARLPNAAVFMTSVAKGTPPALLQNVRVNKVLHETVVILTILTEATPRLPAAERLEVKALGNGLYRVIASYGFMETPSVPALLKQCAEQGLVIPTDKVTYYLGHETLICTKRYGMATWRERIFAFMARNDQREARFFRIPYAYIIEIGSVVEL